VILSRGRHARRREHGVICWLVLADAVLFACCVIAGAIISGR